MTIKEWKHDPNLKRNILVLAVLVFVGAAAYLNWSYNQRWGGTGSAMADAEDQMTTAVNAILGRESGDAAPAASVSGYFSQARLTRQQSRDQALSLLESASCSESASAETIDAAMKEITKMANWSLLESRVENELLAKNFTECVVYMSEDGCTVAVPASTEGLEESQVAQITDVVTSNSDFTPSQINVIAVMEPGVCALRCVSYSTEQTGTRKRASRRNSGCPLYFCVLLCYNILKSWGGMRSCPKAM